MNNKISAFMLSLCFVLAAVEAGLAQTTTPPPPPSVIRIEQVNLDRDSRPDITYIYTEFVVDYPTEYPEKPILEKAKITVLDGSNDMAASDRWQTATDFRNDIWIFDVGEDRTAELIVKFEGDEGRWTAKIYDDRNGDAKVDYSLVGTSFVLTESEYWTVLVSSDAYWIDAAGKASFDNQVSFFVDGFVERGYGLIDVNDLPADYQDLFSNDGQYDFEYRVVDRDEDGIVDYEWMRRIPELPRPHVESRDYLFVNYSSRPPEPYSDAIFWPLLVTAHGYAETYRVFNHTMGVFVDWDRARVWDAGILGYPVERGILINSSSRAMQEGQVNYANFENPMAWYDLAQDEDDEPELFIRLENYAAFDPLILVGRFDHPLARADYAWDQDNDGGWDFQMSVAGKYTIDSLVHFPDLAVYSVPYTQIPQWVAGKSWDTALFVATESNFRGGSEGMYAWGSGEGYLDGGRVYSPLFSEYVTGRADSPPQELYQEIEGGLRGEYSFDYTRTPSLYFSSLDEKLHLLGAQGGVWNLGDGSVIEYANLDSDNFLDQWLYLINGRPIRQLNLAGGYLVYSGDNRVAIERYDGAQALFETRPPRDHAEWLAFNQPFPEDADSKDPVDFGSIMDRIDGPGFRLQAAQMRDFRSYKDGFRFVLDLRPGYQVAGVLGKGFEGLSPGEYLVILSDQNLTIQPASAPSIVLDIEVVNPQDNLLRLQIAATNTGLLDAQYTRLSVIKSCDFAGTPLTLREEIIEMPSGETQGFTYFMGADLTQACSFTVEVRNDEDDLLRSETISISPKNDGALDGETLSLSAHLGEWLPAFVLLALSSLVVGILGFSVFRRGIS